MFLTVREFWLKSRLRRAERRIIKNTQARKKMIEDHAAQVRKMEAIKTKLEAISG
jgi:hypothetical protein